MSKPVFTPGPWRVSDVGMFRVVGSCKGGSLMLEGEFPICDMRGWGHLQYLGEDVASEIQEANAHLIAAAPDLLEACKEAATAIEEIVAVTTLCGCESGGITGPEYVCGYHNLLYTLQDAIKKAEQVTP